MLGSGVNARAPVGAVAGRRCWDKARALSPPRSRGWGKGLRGEAHRGRWLPPSVTSPRLSAARREPEVSALQFCPQSETSDARRGTTPVSLTRARRRSRPVVTFLKNLKICIWRFRKQNWRGRRAPLPKGPRPRLPKASREDRPPSVRGISTSVASGAAARSAGIAGSAGTAGSHRRRGTPTPQARAPPGSAQADPGPRLLPGPPVLVLHRRVPLALQLSASRSRGRDCLVGRAPLIAGELEPADAPSPFPPAVAPHGPTVARRGRGWPLLLRSVDG